MEAVWSPLSDANIPDQMQGSLIPQNDVKARPRGGPFWCGNGNNEHRTGVCIAAGCPENSVGVLLPFNLPDDLQLE